MCGYSAKNPCSKNNGGCDAHAVCYSNVKGQIKCTCKKGYIGNGKTCGGK